MQKIDPVQLEISNFLTKYGISQTRYLTMSESAKVNVSDEMTTDLLKFISTKYNEFDFSEIEKSQGAYSKFKYRDVIDENLRTLEEIYKAHDSKVYDDYLMSCRKITDHLLNDERIYTQAFLDEIGMLQVNYIMMVSSVIYTISTLVMATVRFISIDNDSDIEVLVEDLSKHANYVFLKSSRQYAGMITAGEIKKVNDAFMQANMKMKMANESFTAITITTASLPMLAIPIIILLVFKLIPIIREILYAIYFTRIKIADALNIQIELLNANIEAVDNGSGKNKKKIVARQRKVVKMLTGARNVFMVKVEKAEPQMRREIDSEDRELKNKHGANSGQQVPKAPDIMI